MKFTKRRQSAVEKALQKMKKEESMEFLRMASFNASYSDLRDYIKECIGEDIDIVLIARWYKYHAPCGSQALIIEQMAQEWSNINPDVLLNLTAGINTRLILKLKESLDPQLETSSVSTRLTNLVELLKEQRQLSAELRQHNLKINTRDVYMSGMIDFKEQCLELFKDSPSYDIIEKALNVTLRKIDNS